MTVKVEGSFLPIADDIEGLADKVIRVGIVAPEDSGEAVKANVNEYGARIKVTKKMRGFPSAAMGVHLKKDTKEIVIPERSFLRSTFENDGKLKRMLKPLDDVTDENFNPKKALNQVGILGAKSVRRTINSGVEPENSDLTKRNKGSSGTLRDSGRMRQSIKHAIVSS